MTRDKGRLPSRKWSIAVLGLAGVAIVIFSYILAICVAFACLALPVFLFVVLPLGIFDYIVLRLLLSAFGLAAGFTILWSLIPRKAKVEIHGALIDLSKERRLAEEIEKIAVALNEPMPSEVYLVGEANAFVVETGGFLGRGRRRIMGIGLPLLQMLTVAQFRAVLAHEFAHYYAGDTRLGPWIYSTRRAMVRAYENLGRNSDVLSLLNSWAVVAWVHRLLLIAMKGYWDAFMHFTQAISRRQEFRSDELACHIAGSQALIEGLEGINRCQAAVNSYWSSVVSPVVTDGFQPRLAEGFLLFMQSPNVAKAAEAYLARQNSIAKPSAMDSHPPLNKRIERARLYNLPVPDSGINADYSCLPMVSIMDELGFLEGSLLKKFVPAMADTVMKPLGWDAAGREVYVPKWRRLVEKALPLLSTKTLEDLPALVMAPGPISNLVTNPPGSLLNAQQRDAAASEILLCAFVLCLLDHGWDLILQPGVFRLEYGDNIVELGEVKSAMVSRKLSAQEWRDYCARRGIGDWSFASSSSVQTNSVNSD